MSARSSYTIRRVLIDTSAYFALAELRDTNAPAAQAIVGRLIAEHWRLFTTNFVLSETHALLVARRNRRLALQVLQDIDRSTTTVVRVSAADERRAREILVQYEDKDFSLTDTTSFAVMERLHIPSAFTFDSDFAQFGLNVLR